MVQGRALLGGAFAGAFGTLAMDLLWYVRYRRGGGQSGFTTWELSAGLHSWEDASAPAHVGKLMYEAALRRELPARHAALTSTVMHWGYGINWGVVFAIALGSRHRPRYRQGVLLGVLVWLTSYAVMPIAGFYKPIWQYDAKTLWEDLSAHLLYGFVVRELHARATVRHWDVTVRRAIETVGTSFAASRIGAGRRHHGGFPLPHKDETL
jgi:hypothetical protein